jgi:hypothetical protein
MAKECIAMAQQKKTQKTSKMKSAANWAVPDWKHGLGYVSILLNVIVIATIIIFAVEVHNGNLDAARAFTAVRNQACNNFMANMANNENMKKVTTITTNAEVVTVYAISAEMQMSGCLTSTLSQSQAAYYEVDPTAAANDAKTAMDLTSDHKIHYSAFVDMTTGQAISPQSPLFNQTITAINAAK